MQTLVYENHSMPEKFPFILHTDKAYTSNVTNWHKNPEFLYCISGNATAALGKDRLEFVSGDTIIINPNQLHSITSERTAFYRCLIVDCSFFEENGLCADDYTFDNLVSSPRLGELMEKIFVLNDRPRTPVNVAMMRSLILMYISEICLNYSKPHEKSDSDFSQRSEAVRKVITYIDTHFHEKMPLEQLSEIAGLSKYHFTRVFHEYTGFTITEQINIRRCEEAKRLFSSTDNNVGQVAALCGFENVSYFTKVFKKYTGITPSKAAKENA